MKKIAAILLITILSLSAKMRVVGYSYETDASATDIDYSKYTHVIGSFINSDTKGNLSFLPWTPEADIVAELKRVKSEGVTPMIAVGTTGDTWAMTKDSAARANFISNILIFCDTNGIEGIDLDLEGTAAEFNWGNPATFFPLPYESLAVELRAAMPDTMVLTSAVGSLERSGSQWTDNFIGALDWINVMIYDRFLSWDESPVYNHSSWEAHDSAAYYWHNTRGLSKDKIVLGLPFYALGWDRVNNRVYREDGGWDVTSWNYKDFAERYTVAFDQDTLDFPATDSISYPRAEGITGNGTLFYNSPSLIARKTAWTIDSGYGGVMIWPIDGDIPTADSMSLLRALDSVIVNSVPSPILLPSKSIKKTISINSSKSKIEISNSKNFKELTLYSLNGKEIFSKNITGNGSNIQINNLNLSVGTYVVKLTGISTITQRVLVK